jgi:xylan 1,4-beta-xylosidase
VLVGDWPSVHVRARIDGLVLHFEVSPDRTSWQRVGPPLDLALVSDDHGQRLRFTGAMVGLVAEDTGPGTLIADFDSFTVRPLP